VLATGESQGYYASYIDAPAKHLARCLAEGFAYQGEVSPFSGKPRGEPSRHLPPSAFVNFLQNHDQVGNRAFGERLLSLSNEKSVKALTAVLLLAPSPPLLFMGEEWGCRQPFLFFCDFPGELGEAVRAGRRREFPQISEMPDPTARETFEQCALRWEDADPAWLAWYRDLLKVRRERIVPLRARNGRYRMLGERAFAVSWDGLSLVANLGDTALQVEAPAGAPLWSSGTPGTPWSVGWWLG
jgi:1,4-alpha-glucan branching enzyme/maltooligosyltrehalose trehalohydrolase